MSEKYLKEIFVREIARRRAATTYAASVANLVSNNSFSSLASPVQASKKFND